MTVELGADTEATPAGRAADEALLRRFEPILRFTHGEQFFPMPATDYVTMCDLLSGPTPSTARIVIPKGSLNAGRPRGVRGPAAGRGAVPALRPGAAEPDRARPVQRPPGAAALQGARPAGAGGHPGPHAATPGWSPRCSSAARCPGGTAAAAAVQYEAQRATDPRVSYHGRVVRRDGWVVLQYLFFYAMNDWRSTFEGANDHEADWEQAFVILEETPDGGVDPAWFAAAAHDEKGADLRRRWDDPRLQRDGEHVVVYPGPARMRRTWSRASTSCGSACPARTSCGPSWTTSGRSGATSSASPTRATSPRRSRGCSASRSSTTPGVTGTGSGRGRRSSGRRS